MCATLNDKLFTQVCKNRFFFIIKYQSKLNQEIMTLNYSESGHSKNVSLLIIGGNPKRMINQFVAQCKLFLCNAYLVDENRIKHMTFGMQKVLDI